MKSTDANSKLAEAIDAVAPSERIIHALAGALEADAVARDGTRSPDHRTRVQAAQLLLSYRVGRPSERQPVKEKSADQGESLEEKLIRSPAMRQMYQEIITKAEKAASDGDRPRR